MAVHRTFWVWVAAAAAMSAVLGAAPQTAEARLRAKIYLVQHKIPGGLSERGLLRFARGHHRRGLMETNEQRPRDRSWKANLVVSFSKPPGDLEFHVKFYDVHDGPRQFIEDMAVYVGDRDQETFVSKIHLERPDFQPQRRMELVLTVSRREVARRKFELRGEKKRHTGEVSFSGESAGGSGGEEAEEQEPEEAPEPDPGPAPDPLAVDDEPIDTSGTASAEDMALPSAAPGSNSGEVEPSESGKRGGLCAAGTRGGTLPSVLGLAGLALLLGRRRRRRQSSSAFR